MSRRLVLVLFVAAWSLLLIFMIKDRHDLVQIIQAQERLIETQRALIESLKAVIEQRQGSSSVIPISLSEKRTVVEATVTAYTASKDECDADPNVAASLRKPKRGTVAVSRDLFYSGWAFGRKVYIEGVGIYEINDLMHARFSERVDVFVGTKKQAKAFGARTARVVLIH